LFQPPFPYETHVEKVLTLRSNDTSLLTLLANLLSSAQEYQVAADLYNQILKTDPAGALNNPHNIVNAFNKAEQLDDLIQFTKDPEFIRKVNGANSWGFTNFLQQIGSQLENEKRLEEALQFRIVALDYLDWNNRINQVDAVLDLQIKLGRPEEARETLWTTVFAEEEDSDTADTRFGFNSNNSHRNGLFNNMSYSNSTFTIRGVQLLDRANQLGLNERLLTWTEEDRPGWISDGDANLIQTFVRLNQQDPTLLAEIEDEEFLTTLHNNSLHRSSAVLFTIAERLALWEEAREVAFQLYKDLITLPSFNSSAIFGNSSDQQILIRSSIALIDLAQTEEENKEANQILQKTLDKARLSFNATNNSQISKELVVGLLTKAIQQDVLTEEELQDWFDKIRNISNWGNHAESTAAYLEVLAGDNLYAPLYPALINGETIRPMANVTAILKLEDSQSKERLLDASFFTLEEQPILYATPAPNQAPVALSTGAPLDEFLAAALPDGFGYLLLSRPDENPDNAERNNWAPVSLLPNLLAYPNPAEAPASSDDDFQKEGWAELPALMIETVRPSDEAPILRGNRVVASGNDYNRKTLLSDRISIDGQKDILLSGWFHGLDSRQDEGYLSFGLTFFDEDQKRIRTLSEWTRIPFDDLWAPLSILYTADDSERKGRYSYPKNARYIEVKLDIDPGVVFGGLHLSEIPQASQSEAIDTRQTLNDAIKAAREEEAEKASALYYQALQYDPGRAVSYWRGNEDYWTTAMETGGKLEEIFRFLAYPGVHDESSFRYYRRSVRDRNDLYAIAELAIQNPDTPGSEAFLDIVFLGETCLNDEQKDRLLLKARAAGIRSGLPEENLELGLKTLQLMKEEDNSNHPSLSEWETALLNLEQLGILDTVLETLRSDDAPLSPETTDSRLIQAWILASTDPAASSRMLQELAENGPTLNDHNRQLVALILGRIATTDSGVTPAREALRSISASAGDSEADRAEFRYETLEHIVEAQEDPSAELLASMREAKLEWIVADPDRNISALRDLLRTLVNEQDFATAQRIAEASAETSHHINTINPYNHVFSRLSQPEVNSLWPVALAGSADNSENNSILIRFHPNNNYPPESLNGGSPRLTTAPLLETVPGLERVELRFGPFPAELKTVAEFSGDEASREVSLQLPAANGFLRAVAFIDGREIPGPITPVFTGGSTVLLDPEADSSPPKTGSFSALPPKSSELISTTKTRTLDPDRSGIDLSRQDLVLLAWATSESGQRTIRTFPGYSERDPIAPEMTDVLVGELTFFSALVPGESGWEEISPLEKVDLRIYEKTQVSPVQMVAVDRDQSEYLSWMKDVREMAAKLRSDETVPPQEVIETARRDLYGSAGYLLEYLIPAIIETEGPARAIEYLQSLTPINASPFHQSKSYHQDIRNILLNIIETNELSDEIRWEAALTTMRIPDISPIYRIGYLYDAAGDDPDRRQYARDQMISWIKGDRQSMGMANYQLKREVGNYHTSNWIPHNHLNDILVEGYDKEIDQLIRRRLAEADYELESQPGKQFVFATLLAEPGQNPAITEILDESLNSSHNSYTKGLTTVVGFENLKSRGFTNEAREELLLHAIEVLLKEDPLDNKNDPPRGLILITGAIFRNNSQPPVEPMIQVAKWITEATHNSRTSPYYLCSESTFLLIDTLGEVGEDNISDELLSAIRIKAKDSRYAKTLNKRYPETDSATEAEEPEG